MPKFNLECLYCGKIWSEYLYGSAQLESMRCESCNDRNIKATEETSKDIFGYNWKESNGK